MVGKACVKHDRTARFHLVIVAAKTTEVVHSVRRVLLNGENVSRRDNVTEFLDKWPSKLAASPHLILLDGAHVDLNENLTRIRKGGYDGLIACVGQTSTIDEEAASLEAGADWFLCRPINPSAVQQLVCYARMKSMSSPAYSVHGPIRLAPFSRTLLLEDRSLILTDSAYRLLALLAHSFGTWVSLDTVARHFGWSTSEAARWARAKELVRRVRRRLGEHGHTIKVNRRLGICWSGPT